MKSGNVEVLHPEYGLKEKVTYIGLPKRFIAGAVVFGDTDECGEGAKVTLQGKGEKRVTKTDNYGDFEFEVLKLDKAYRVKVESAGYRPYEIEVNTKVDVYLGDIVLARIPMAKSTKMKSIKTKRTKTKGTKAKAKKRY
jgi:hypothetical protein